MDGVTRQRHGGQSQEAKVTPTRSQAPDLYIWSNTWSCLVVLLTFHYTNPDKFSWFVYTSVIVTLVLEWCVCVPCGLNPACEHVLWIAPQHIPRTWNKVPDVEEEQERRFTKGPSLLRKEGPPTFAILSRNLVLSRFDWLSQSFERKTSCFRRGFNESHHTFWELSTK